MNMEHHCIIKLIYKYKEEKCILSKLQFIHLLTLMYRKKPFFGQGSNLIFFNGQCAIDYLNLKNIIWTWSWTKIYLEHGLKIIFLNSD